MSGTVHDSGWAEDKHHFRKGSPLTLDRRRGKRQSFLMATLGRRDRSRSVPHRFAASARRFRIGALRQVERCIKSCGLNPHGVKSSVYALVALTGLLLLALLIVGTQSSNSMTEMAPFYHWNAWAVTVDILWISWLVLHEAPQFYEENTTWCRRKVMRIQTIWTLLAAGLAGVLIRELTVEVSPTKQLHSCMLLPLAGCAANLYFCWRFTTTQEQRSRYRQYMLCDLATVGSLFLGALFIGPFTNENWTEPFASSWIGASLTLPNLAFVLLILRHSYRDASIRPTAAAAEVQQ